MTVKESSLHLNLHSDGADLKEVTVRKTFLRTGILKPPPPRLNTVNMQRDFKNKNTQTAK